MNSLTVRQQLLCAFGSLALLVLAVSLTALYSLSESKSRFHALVNEAGVREALATELTNAVNARAIAARNLVLVDTQVEAQVEAGKVRQAHEAAAEALKQLQAAVDAGTGASDRDRELVAEVGKIEAAYAPVVLGIVKLIADDKRREAMYRMHADDRPLLASLLRASDDYRKYSDQQARASVEDSDRSYAARRVWLVGVSIVAVASAAMLGWFITRSLFQLLGAEPAELTVAVRKVAQGDLNVVAGSEGAPAGSVLGSVAAMQSQLERIIGQVRSAADSIADASGEIAQGNQDLSHRTEQQASSLQTTSSSLEQFGSTVKQNAESAGLADQLARGASEVATRGSAVVDQVVAVMKGINESSRMVADIVGVIDSIAFQTNILALNAAVEAAGAGEHGRGFAVVAGEVRELAQRSAKAAKEIKALIAESVGRVDQGAALVDRAGETMTEVVASIRRVTDLMGDISLASSEQSAGLTQMVHAMSQLDQMTQQNASLVEESAAAAESLKLHADQLVGAVAVFKLAEQVHAPLSQSPA